jgi:hypothetical protein
MVDMSSVSEMASASGSLLTLTQYAHNDLVANGFMQIADCSLVSQSNAQILCLGHNEILIEAAVITVRTTMFYSAHHDAYGMLIYREYHQITGDKECSVIADGMTLYLDPSCCSNLEATNGDWGFCPFTPLVNAPRLLESANGIFSLSVGPFEIRCQNGDYVFNELKSLVSDCAVKALDTVKHGLGDFLSEFPEELSDDVHWRDILLVVLLVVVVLIAMLIFCLLISFWYRHHRMANQGSDPVDQPKDVYNPPEMQSMLATPDLPQYF